MGAIEGQKICSANDWEQIKRDGDVAIKRWINNNMDMGSCVIVLIGSETASRKWVQYEIEKAWNDGKALMGIYIHNLKDPIDGTCQKGENPFEQFTTHSGEKLSNFIPTFNPNTNDAYNDIKNNLAHWIETAIAKKRN